MLMTAAAQSNSDGSRTRCTCSQVVRCTSLLLRCCCGRRILLSISPARPSPTCWHLSTPCAFQRVINSTKGTTSTDRMPQVLQLETFWQASQSSRESLSHVNTKSLLGNTTKVLLSDLELSLTQLGIAAHLKPGDGAAVAGTFHTSYARRPGAGVSTGQCKGRK